MSCAGTRLVRAGPDRPHPPWSTHAHQPSRVVVPGNGRRPDPRGVGPGVRDVLRHRVAVAVGFEPTEGVALTRFRGVLLRPLGHATAEETTGPVERGRTHVAAWRTPRPGHRPSPRADG